MEYDNNNGLIKVFVNYTSKVNLRPLSEFYSTDTGYIYMTTLSTLNILF